MMGALTLMMARLAFLGPSSALQFSPEAGGDSTGLGAAVDAAAGAIPASAEALASLAPRLAGMDPLSLIWEASWLVQGVMALLAMFSIVSWAVIFVKSRELKAAERDSDLFLEIYHEGSSDSAYEAARELRRSPLAKIFLAAYRERTRIAKYAQASAGNGLDVDQRHRLSKHILWNAQEEARRLESRLTFLATTGSATPFIGLFGTVVGIINAFTGIGASGSASLAVVAPGIAEALIATALGLFAAIPATIFYNGFVGRLRGVHGAIEIYANELEGDLARPLGFAAGDRQAARR